MLSIHDRIMNCNFAFINRVAKIQTNSNTVVDNMFFGRFSSLSDLLVLLRVPQNLNQAYLTLNNPVPSVPRACGTH